MLVSVFVPFADERDNLQEVALRVRKGAEEAETDFEIIFVDDGSKDGSGEIVREMSEKDRRIKLFSHRRNLGLTEAMKTGFPKCKGDYILFFPADLESHPDEDIPVILEELKKGTDVVCGKREGRREFKVFLSKIYNDISNFLFRMNLHDMNWIKGFKRECLEDLELRSDWHRFIAQILKEKGYSIGEVSVHWYKRKKGKTHFGLKRIPISFFDAVSVKLILTFTRAPMRIFGALGLLQCITGILITVWMLYSSFILGTGEFRLRPLLYMSGALFLSGLIFFFMGFLAELIVSIKEDISKMEDKK